MTEDKAAMVDSDHEIEEFLQEFIVEKVTSRYETSMIVIKDGISELREKITSIKNTNNTTNQDISVLIKNDNALMGDVDGIAESVKKISKKVETVIMSQSEIKSLIPNDEKIIEELSVKWTEMIVPVQVDISNCIDEVSELANAIGEVTEKIEILQTIGQDIQGKFEVVVAELNSLKEILQAGQISINEIANVAKRIEDDVSEKSEELLKNDGIILQGIHELNQKTKFLLVTVGIDTILIFLLLIAFICK